MDTKIFIGLPLDSLLKKEMEGQTHSLIITLSEGKEFIGLRSKSNRLTLIDLKEMRQELLTHLNRLPLSFLVDIDKMVLFPELLLG